MRFARLRGNVPTQSGSLLEGLEVLTKKDYFPNFSNKTRAFLASPIGWLVLAASLALICAACISPRVWSIFVCIVGLILVGLIWPWLTLRTLRLWLAFAQDRVVEGELVRVTARVENFSFLPAFGLSIRGDFQADEEGVNNFGELAARLPFCGAGRETECNWNFAPAQRGLYPLQTPYLGTGFPFGLWETRRKAEASSSLIVWPVTYPVGPIPHSHAEALLDGNVSRNRAGSECELMGVRPYRRGDSPRRIHWAQSARHDRLIVCELESTARPTVRIVLDLDSSIHTDGPHGSREWSIRIAASFAKGWIEAGAELSLLAEGIDLPLSSGTLQIRRILDALAKLPRESTCSLEDLMRLSSKANAGVSVIITSDRRYREAHRRNNQDIRWVVLKSSQFAHPECPQLPADQLELGQNSSVGTAWLTIESPEKVRYALRNGWMEARNGS